MKIICCQRIFDSVVFENISPNNLSSRKFHEIYFHIYSCERKMEIALEIDFDLNQ